MTSAVLSRSEDRHSFVWRVAAPSLAVSAALLAIAGLAAVSLVEAKEEAEEALNQATEAVQASATLDEVLREMRDRLTSYGETGNDQELYSLNQLWKSRLAPRYSTGPVPHGFEDAFDRLERRVNAMMDEVDAEQRRAIAGQLVDNILKPELLTEAELQRRIAGSALEDAIQRNRELTGWTLWMVLLLGVAGAGAGALAGFGLARTLRRKLVELSVPIRSAAGTLDAVVGPVELRGGEDVEDLEGSLHLLADRVTDVVKRLQTAEHESLRNDQLAALGQLAAGLAHELRNPLTAIRTLVEVARSNGAAAPLDGRDLEVIDEELGRLDNTLQSFLDYARPPKLERKPVDLRDVVGRTVTLVKPRAERQSVTIDVDSPGDPLMASADAEQLRQVLLNLLLNALDALGAGGRILVTSATDPDRRQVIVRVADDGPGIPDSVRDKLFEPFASSKPAGTGLGLTISRRIVENHGGTITAENGPNGGALFTIRLPAQ